MVEINWQDPPPKKTGGDDHREFAEALRQRPGKWAIWRTSTVRSNSTVSQVSNGQPKAFTPKGSYEATGRSNGDELTIYVRYVGEPEAAS